MADISIENISEFDFNGNDLFEDSESYITEISDDNEEKSIIGGSCLCSGCCCSNSVYF